MRQVIVAFERQANCDRLREIMEAGGEFSCVMCRTADQAQLDLCEAEGIFKLQSPIRRSELMASVRLLVQVAQSAARESSQGHYPARRSQEEQELVERAKVVLMDRHGMTEEQAHRFLQKRSMDNGARLTDTATLVLADQ